MRNAYTPHQLNVIGAFILGASDDLQRSAEQASGMSGASSAALVVLEQVEGRTVDSLARSLRLSHSRAVRITDSLEAQGLARRVPSSVDKRAVLVELTAKGRGLARRVHQARREVLEGALADLGPAEVDQLSEMAGRVLGRVTTGRERANSICRLCDAVGCGHFDGRCPVTNAADAVESLAG